MTTLSQATAGLRYRRVRTRSFRFVQQRIPAIFGRIGLYSVLVILSISYLLPFIWMVSTSLKDDPQIFRLPPELIPSPVRWENYPEMLVYLPWGTYVFNTIVRYAAPAVLGSLLASPLVAYGFSRIRWRLREPLFYLCVATMMIPFQVTMIPLFILFHRMGWTNTFLPLTVPAFFGYPYYIFLLRQFFRTIPEELTDAARIDGCSELGIYARIILPLAKPAITVVGLFEFMGVWHDYLGPKIYLNDPKMFTIALGLEQMQNIVLERMRSPHSYAYLMAGAATFAAPVVILYYFVQRTFIEGITLTGLKG